MQNLTREWGKKNVQIKKKFDQVWEREWGRKKNQPLKKHKKYSKNTWSWINVYIVTIVIFRCYCFCCCPAATQNICVVFEKLANTVKHTVKFVRQARKNSCFFLLMRRVNLTKWPNDTYVVLPQCVRGNNPYICDSNPNPYIRGSSPNPYVRSSCSKATSYAVPHMYLTGISP